MKIVSRRDFLKTLGLAGAAAVTWSAFPAPCFAANNGTRVLFMNLNGGLDGLYSLQPRSGSILSTLGGLRPTLCTNAGSLLAADSAYGFHPNLPLFQSLFQSGELSAILRVGYENMSRSHLDSEMVMARGVPNRLSSSSTGFLNRLGAANGWDSLHAVSVTGSDMAFEGGAYRGLQVRSLEDFYFRSAGTWSEQSHLVATAYSIAHDTDATAREKLGDFAKNFQLAADGTDMIKAAVQDHAPAVSYPATQFGRALKDIDIVFSTPELQTQVGYLRVGGFDTHSTQATTLDRLLLELNNSLSAFITSMKSKNMWDNLIILISSEFGRTTRENGSQGTDHGGANTMFALGGAVNGGGVFGTISSSDLSDNGWLPVQYNIVEVYRRIVERMGLDPDAVFAANTGPSLAGLF